MRGAGESLEKIQRQVSCRLYRQNSVQKCRDHGVGGDKFQWPSGLEKMPGKSQCRGISRSTCQCNPFHPSKVYASLKSNLLALFFYRATAKRVVFQHDNAPPHTAASTTQWLTDKGVKVLQPQWPPQSPDLNLVEHLWGEVNRNMDTNVFNSKDDLWDALDKGFAAIKPEYVKRLYGSMLKRLRAVIAAKGGNTKY